MDYNKTQEINFDKPTKELNETLDLIAWFDSII